MLLKEIVKINEAAIVESAINFSFMGDDDSNRRLCEGFIFNFTPSRPKDSTVGVLNVMRRSFHSQSEPNIHLMVQDYGKGKSHFALALANFFKKEAHSPEVQGIFRQIEIAIAGHSNGLALLEDLKAYKQRGRHLVICLSGDQGGDLKRNFLQTLNHILAEENVTDSIAQNLCQQPISYLEGLSPDQKAQANAYLKKNKFSEGDVDAVIQLLKDNDYQFIRTVEDISRIFNQGLPVNFETSLDIEKILNDLIETLCTGSNPRFQGILILVDELNAYLRSWKEDPIGAGGDALQNITNVCMSPKGKSKIALLSFSQIDPSKSSTRGDFLKFVSRLAPIDATYTPISSLELVIDGLLDQQTSSSAWKSFQTQWGQTLRSVGRLAFEKRIPNKEGKLSQEDFFNHISVGCFPLHPLTAHLLCNLDFTQGRTAIGFIKGEVKDFIQREAVKDDGTLNYLYPVTLVDAFDANFSKKNLYEEYKNALNAIAASANDEEKLVLKAIFLFFASGDKLSKAPNEKHEEILRDLTGLSVSRLKDILDRLCNQRQIIYPRDNTYQFFTGANPIQIERDIDLETLNEEAPISLVTEYCRNHIDDLLGGSTIDATKFVEDNKLRTEDWKFENRICTIEELERLISQQSIKNLEERGLLAYVIDESKDDLDALRHEIKELLIKSPVRSHIAVALAKVSTGNTEDTSIARLLLKLKTLETKPLSEKRDYGSAYTQLVEKWKTEIDRRIKEIFKQSNTSYHCYLSDRIPPHESTKPDRVVSELLKGLYPFVPTVDSIEKLRANHPTGSKVVGYAAKHLIADTLTLQALPENSYKNVLKVFTDKWKLLKVTPHNKYSPKVPEGNIRVAWDKITELCELDSHEITVNLNKLWETLSKPPFGYSEYNFTMLLAAWLSYPEHHRGLLLKGKSNINIPAKKKAETPVIVETKSLRDWVSGEATIFDKPKDFVEKWIILGGGKLIRRQVINPPPEPVTPLDYESAKQYLQSADAFLASLAHDSPEALSVRNQHQRIHQNVQDIDKWYAPIAQTETFDLNTPIETLAQIYPKVLEAPRNADITPTDTQKESQRQALSRLRQLLEERVNQLQIECDSLNSLTECSTYLSKLETTIAQLQLIDELPERYIQSLTAAKTSLQGRQAQFQELDNIEQRLQLVKSRADGLNQLLASQADYANAVNAIEQIANELPALRIEERYHQILSNIQEKQAELERQIERWESCDIDALSKSEMSNMRMEIEKQEARYTDFFFQERLKGISEQLERKLLAINKADDLQKDVTRVLERAKQEIQSIRTTIKIDSVIESFKRLQALQLPQDSNISLAEQQAHLTQSKSNGYELAIEKLKQMISRCEHSINVEEDYRKYLELFQRTQKLIASNDEFAHIYTQIDAATHTLEQKYEAFRKKVADEKILKEIRKRSLTQTTTIRQSEEAIRDIERLRQQLSNAEEYGEQIQTSIESFGSRIKQYVDELNHLQNRIGAIANEKELSRFKRDYDKLYLVFKDSFHYSAYQAIQASIEIIESEIDELRDLEVLKQQSGTIALCDRSLQRLATERIKIADRFQAKISEIEIFLNERISSYRQELDYLSQRTKTVTGLRVVQNLQAELSRKANLYLDTETDTQNYNQLSHLLSRLQALYSLTESAKCQTLQDFDAQLNDLQQWHSEEGNLPEWLEERYSTALRETERNRHALIEKDRKDAREWLKKIDLELQEVLTDSDTDYQGKGASELRAKLNKEKVKYTNGLTEDMEGELAEINRQCTEICDRDLENQILSRFRQLPQSQRVSLYEKLQQYLADSTEEL